MTTESPSRLDLVEAILAMREHFDARLDDIDLRLGRVGGDIRDLSKKMDSLDKKMDRLIKDVNEELDRV